MTRPMPSNAPRGFGDRGDGAEPGVPLGGRLGAVEQLLDELLLDAVGQRRLLSGGRQRRDGEPDGLALVLFLELLEDTGLAGAARAAEGDVEVLVVLDRSLGRGRS